MRCGLRRNVRSSDALPKAIKENRRIPPPPPGYLAPLCRDTRKIYLHKMKVAIEMRRCKLGMSRERLHLMEVSMVGYKPDLSKTPMYFVECQIIPY